MRLVRCALQTGAVFVSFLLSGGAFGQVDGNWLKQNFDARERVALRTATSADLEASRMLTSFVAGVISLQRSNNLRAKTLLALMKSDPSVRPEEVALAIKTTAYFTPLRSVPENLSVDQVMTTIKNYVNAHPANWGWGGDMLVTEALATAYPPTP